MTTYSGQALDSWIAGSATRLTIPRNAGVKSIQNSIQANMPLSIPPPFDPSDKTWKEKLLPTKDCRAKTEVSYTFSVNERLFFTQSSLLSGRNKSCRHDVRGFWPQTRATDGHLRGLLFFRMDIPGGSNLVFVIDGV